MSQAEALIQLLADGKFHSGEQLAEQLGCSRSAIWKSFKRIKETLGIRIDAVSGRGYRLPHALELLQQNSIVEQISNKRASGLQHCHIFQSVESTNLLASKAALSVGQSEAWFAEHQTSGRGRRGKIWVSSFGQNIYFSLARRFDLPLTQLSGLSIAMGAVLADLLSEYGLSKHGLKWPNDVLWQDKKVAGILLEAAGETDGPATAILGVGVNLFLDTETKREIDQVVATLSDAGLLMDRNKFAGTLLDRTLQLCDEYEEQGITPFLEKWRAHDLHYNKPVQLTTPSKVHKGMSQGLADDGGLRLKIDNTVKTYYAGEVSLRAE